MNRRSFLKMFAAVSAVASTNPVHFLAPAGGWHDRRFMTMDWGFGESKSVLTLVDHNRFFYLGAMGVYENGVLISHHIEKGIEGWLERENSMLICNVPPYPR